MKIYFKKMVNMANISNIRFKTVDEYIANHPKEVQIKLKKIQDIIKKVAPDSQEIISYNMPAYKIHGRILLYFAVHTEHIGLYAMPSAIVHYKKELIGYETSKGTIKFPKDKPIPYDLVRKIVKFRVNENLQKKR
jgi:uncharacterized protein YdhG (YjbR/CyaY superfamily)